MFPMLWAVWHAWMAWIFQASTAAFTMGTSRGAKLLYLCHGFIFEMSHTKGIGDRSTRFDLERESNVEAVASFQRNRYTNSRGARDTSFLTNVRTKSILHAPAIQQDNEITNMREISGESIRIIKQRKSVAIDRSFQTNKHRESNLQATTISQNHETTHTRGTGGRNSRIDLQRESNLYAPTVHQVNDDNSCTKKRTRGPTFMLKVWGLHPGQLDGEHIKVNFNKNGQPIGENKKTFVEFLGTIARNGVHAPLDITTWDEMKKSLKRDMLNVVKEKFELPPGTEAWTLQSIGKKWRNWKPYVKKTYYIPELSVQEHINKKPTRVVGDQWKNILMHWSSEKAKLVSHRNKISRMKKTIMHTTGKRSFGEISYEEEQNLGRSPSRFEIFKKCYTKNGVSSDENVTDALNKMKELQSRQSEDVRDIGRDDIFSQVMGPDKGGRVRIYGLGVTPSDAWGEVPSRNSSYRMAMGYKNAFEKLEKRFTDEIGELKMAIHQRQQDSTPRPTSPLEPSRDTLFSSQHSLNNINRQHRLQVGATVSIRSTVDPTKIVAIGCLDSLNPLHKIGGRELGPNWCGVRINTPMEWDEQLIRPYGDFKLIEDVIGISIAWPVSLVVRDEE